MGEENRLRRTIKTIRNNHKALSYSSNETGPIKIISQIKGDWKNEVSSIVRTSEGDVYYGIIKTYEEKILLKSDQIIEILKNNTCSSKSKEILDSLENINNELSDSFLKLRSISSISDTSYINGVSIAIIENLVEVYLKNSNYMNGKLSNTFALSILAQLQSSISKIRLLSPDKTNFITELTNKLSQLEYFSASKKELNHKIKSFCVELNGQFTRLQDKKNDNFDKDIEPICNKIDDLMKDLFDCIKKLDNALQ